MNITTFNDCPSEAFKIFRGMPHKGRLWYAVRIKQNRFRVFKTQLQAINNAADSRVWSFAPNQNKPFQLTGRPL